MKCNLWFRDIRKELQQVVEANEFLEESSDIIMKDNQSETSKDGRNKTNVILKKVVIKLLNSKPVPDRSVEITRGRI